MNVDSTTASTSKTTEHTSSTSSPATATKDGSNTFKDELVQAKTQEDNIKATETKEAQISATKLLDTKEAKASKDNILQQISKGKLTNEKEELRTEGEAADVVSSLSKLNSKIATINMLKAGSNKDAKTAKAKSGERIDGDFFPSIKMDDKDVSFFLSLTENQQMTAQASQASIKNDLSSIGFNEIKAEATQKTVQVSQTILDALNDSAKTNKPFRIDFGGDVSVIMRVDKNGTISANFLPGNAAVEAYLKNNIASLKLNFDNQNLAYNALTYSEKYKENQQGKQQQKQEKDDE